VEVKPYGRIYADMLNHIIANQDRITDFNDGSVISSQVEATAREIAMAYVACRVGFSTHLRSLPYSIFGFGMKDGLRASAKVVFSRSRPQPHETQIPAGTLVAAGSLQFATTEAGAVPSGETDSAPIPAAAQAAGDGHNVAAGAISRIVSTLPADIVTASNPEPAAGGESAEDWASYMHRFADYILGLQRTNAAGFLTGLQGGGLIRSMGIRVHFPPLDGIWNATLYLEDGSGGMAPEALAEARRIIDGDFLGGAGGYRAPGVNLRYLTPEIVPVAAKVEVSASRDMVEQLDTASLEGEAAAAVRAHVNGLRIGEPVLVSDLIVALRRLPFLSNARVIWPETDVWINKDDQIARHESCGVEVEIGGR